LADIISILIVDDVEDLRSNVKKLLSFEKDFKVVGEAGNGIEAVDLAQRLKPDIILMDINMPKMDGITATEIITVKCPYTSVIIMSVQEEQEYLRKAMMAGARDFLVKPFSNEELVSTIRKLYERAKAMSGVAPVVPASKREFGKIITFFSTKGGVGKTTLIINTAVALKKYTQKKVALVDLDLQFGDVGIMLNTKSPNTISELVQEEALTFDIIKEFMLEHEVGVDLLLSCSKPAYAEMVSASAVREILEALRENYNYVLIDTSPIFRDIELTALDISDKILLVVTLELSAIKSVKLSLEIMNELEYPEDKVKIICNRSYPTMGIEVKDVENTLKRPVAVKIPSDGSLVVPSLNKGVPFVLENENAGVSKAVLEIVKLFAEVETTAGKEEKGILGKLFGFGGK